jgi:ParB family chromosome partitioning protein
VRPSSGGRYILIAGERRLRAAGLAGLKMVPVLVREDADSGARQLELALVENLQRADLNPVESGRGYQRLAEEYGYTQQEIADKVGKDRSTVANAMRLLNLPDNVLKLVESGAISAGHARALLGVRDPEVLRKICADIVALDLSVRAVERMVRQQRDVQRTVRTEAHKEKVLHYANELLTRALSTKVEIKPRRAGGGRIMIDFHSDEDLERLIQALRGEE